MKKWFSLVKKNICLIVAMAFFTLVGLFAGERVSAYQDGVSFDVEMRNDQGTTVSSFSGTRESLQEAFVWWGNSVPTNASTLYMKYTGTGEVVYGNIDFFLNDTNSRDYDIILDLNGQTFSSGLNSGFSFIMKESSSSGRSVTICNGEIIGQFYLEAENIDLQLDNMIFDLSVMSAGNFRVFRIYAGYGFNLNVIDTEIFADDIYDMGLSVINIWYNGYACEYGPNHDTYCSDGSSVNIENSTIFSYGSVLEIVNDSYENKSDGQGNSIDSVNVTGSQIICESYLLCFNFRNETEPEWEYGTIINIEDSIIEMNAADYGFFMSGEEKEINFINSQVYSNTFYNQMIGKINVLGESHLEFAGTFLFVNRGSSYISGTFVLGNSSDVLSESPVVVLDKIAAGLAYSSNIIEFEFYNGSILVKGNGNASGFESSDISSTRDLNSFNLVFEVVQLDGESYTKAYYEEVSSGSGSVPQENEVSLTYNGSTTEQSTIIVALSNCGGQCTITLLRDVTKTSSIQVSEGKDVTFDLNGHTYSTNTYIYVYGELKIIDTVGGGGIYQTNITKYAINIEDGGQVILNGGQIFSNGEGIYVGSSSSFIMDDGLLQSSDEAIFNNAQVSINQGVVKSTTSYGVYNASSSSSLTIGVNENSINYESVKVTGLLYGVFGGGLLNFYNGSILGSTAPYQSYPTGTRNDGINISVINDTGYKKAIYASASIGQTYYPYIKNAISSCTMCTIKLLSNVTENDVSFSANKSVTFNLNGHVWTSNTAISVYGSATIIDISVNGTGKIYSTSSNYAINVASTGQLTLNSGSIISDKAGAKAIYNNFMTVINGGLVESKYAEAIRSVNGTLIVGSSTSILSDSSPIIRGATYGVVINSNTTFNFYNGSIWGETDSYSGTINNQRSEAAIVDTTVSVENNTYDVSLYARVSMNNSYYPSIQGAIDACGGTCIVTLLASFSENEVTFPSSKIITIDLNGKTWSSEYMHDVYGDLRIADSSSSKNGIVLVNGGNEVFYVLDDASLTLNSGTIKNTGSGSDAYGIWNLGAVTVNGGIIESSSSYGIYNEGAVAVGYFGSTVNETSVIVRGSNYGIYNETNGSFNFYNGSIWGRTGAYNTSPSEVRSDYGAIIKNQTYNNYTYKEAYLVAVQNNVALNTTLGVTYYETVYAAVNACTSPCNLSLVNNTTDTNYITFSKNVTLDIGGYTWTSSNINYVTGTLQLKGSGTILNTNNVDPAFIVDNSGYVVLNGNLNLIGQRERLFQVSGGGLEIYGNTNITSNFGGSWGAIMLDGGLVAIPGNVTINSTSEAGISINSGELYIGGYVSSSSDYPLIRGAMYGLKAMGGSVYFYNGSLWGKTASYTGTFTETRCNYVTCVLSTTTDTYNEENYSKSYFAEAKVTMNGNNYLTIQDAVNAAEDCSSCVALLIGDITESSVSVPAGTSLTLDLNNFIWTTRGNNGISGNLTIRDSSINKDGRIISSTNDFGITLFNITSTGTVSLYSVVSVKTFAIYNYGKLNLYDGANVSLFSVYNYGTMLVDGGYLASRDDTGIVNNGTLTINRGNVTNTTYISIINNSGATLVINGGTVNSNYASNSTIENYGSFTMNEGQVLASPGDAPMFEGYAIENKGSGNLVINGGVVYSSTKSAIYNNSANAVVQIGSNTSGISTSSPIIRGYVYGVEKASGTFNFYNGAIWGINGSYSGTINNQRNDSSLYSEDDQLYDTNYYTITYFKLLPVTLTIGETTTYHDSINAASSACTSGSTCTIKLLEDVTNNNVIFSSNKTITLDLNGKTWNSTYGTHEIYGALIIDNFSSTLGKIQFNLSDNGNGYMVYVDGGDLTINNGTINLLVSDQELNSLTGIFVAEGALVMNGGSIYSNAVAVHVNDQLTINNGSIHSENIAIKHLGGSFIINNGSVISNGNVAIDSSSVSTIINGGVIESYENNAIRFGGGTISINGGRIDSSNGYGVLVDNSNAVLNIGSSADEIDYDDIIIRGSTYGINVSSGTVNFCNGSIWGKTGAYSGTVSNCRTDSSIGITTLTYASETYKVARHAKVSLTDGESITLYMSVADAYVEAVSSCTSACTITLLSNITEAGITLGNNYQIILDLSTYTWTISSGTNTISGTGGVLVRGETGGAITSTNQVFTINSSRQLTIESGAITSSNIAIVNNGTVTITGGTITSTGNNAITNSGTLTLGVNDSTVSTSSPIVVGNDYAINNSGTVNFYDGVLYGSTSRSHAISGGTINVPANYTYSSSTDTYNSASKIKTILVVGVVKITSTGTLYPTLQSAVNACSSACTIEFVRNFAESGVTFNKTFKITLDLKSYTWTIDSGTNTISGTGEVAFNTSSSGGKIESSSSSPAFTVNSSRKLNIQKVTIQSSNGSIISNSGSVTILSGTIKYTGSSSINAISNGGTLTLGDNASSVSIISPVIVGGNYAISSSGTVNFYDGALYGSVDNEHAINGGTINVPTDYEYTSSEATYETVNRIKTILTQVQIDYSVELLDSSGNLIDQLMSLEEAIYYNQDFLGYTARLLADINECLVIEDDILLEGTIDLNGHTWSADNCGNLVITTDGSLTIENGFIYSYGEGNSISVYWGTVNINNVQIYATYGIYNDGADVYLNNVSIEASFNAIFSEGGNVSIVNGNIEGATDYYFYGDDEYTYFTAIENYGNMVIESECDGECEDDELVHINAPWGYGINTDGDLTLNNVIVSGRFSALRIGGGEIQITGGEYGSLDNSGYAVIDNYGNLTIENALVYSGDPHGDYLPSGGAIYSDGNTTLTNVTASGTYAFASGVGTIEISGGTFTGYGSENYAIEASTDSITIEDAVVNSSIGGGIYSDAPEAYYINVNVESYGYALYNKWYAEIEGGSYTYNSWSVVQNSYEAAIYNCAYDDETGMGVLLIYDVNITSEGYGIHNLGYLHISGSDTVVESTSTYAVKNDGDYEFHYFDGALYSPFSTTSYTYSGKITSTSGTEYTTYVTGEKYTTTIVFGVVITEDFITYDNFYEAIDAILEDGGSNLLTLLKDITVSYVNITDNLVLDLGGHSINNYYGISDGNVVTYSYSIFEVAEGGSFTIKGSGNIDADFRSGVEAIKVHDGGEFILGDSSVALSDTLNIFASGHAINATGDVSFLNGVLYSKIQGVFSVPGGHLSMRTDHYVKFSEESTYYKASLVANSSSPDDESLSSDNEITYEYEVKTENNTFEVTITNTKEIVNGAINLYKDKALVSTCSGSSTTVFTCSTNLNNMFDANKQLYNVEYQTNIDVEYIVNDLVWEVIDDAFTSSTIVNRVQNEFVGESDEDNSNYKGIFTDGDIIFINRTNGNAFSINGIDSIYKAVYGDNISSIVTNYEDELLESVMIQLEAHDWSANDTYTSISTIMTQMIDVSLFSSVLALDIIADFPIPVSMGTVKVILYDYSPYTVSEQVASLSNETNCEMGGLCEIETLAFKDYMGNYVSNVETVITLDNKVVDSIDTSVAGRYVVTTSAKDSNGYTSADIVRYYNVVDNNSYAYMLPVNNNIAEDNNSNDNNDSVDNNASVERTASVSFRLDGKYIVTNKTIDVEGNEIVSVSTFDVKKYFKVVKCLIGLVLAVTILACVNPVSKRKRMNI